MKRREFVRNAAMLGTTVGLWSDAAAPAAASLSDQRVAQVRSSRDDADRNPARDPHAVLRSTLVVDGQDQFVPDYDGAIRIFREGGVDCVQATMWGGLQSFADLYNFIDQHKSEVTVARSVAEIRRAHQEGPLALVLGWQTAKHLQLDPENPLSGPPKTPLRAYYEMGLRLSMFTYNVANMFAGGNVGEDSKIGLTNAGRRLLEEFHKLGIVADVGGHSSEQAAYDAIAMSAGIPVICSHTNARALNDHVRAMSDRLMEAIARTGGVIGLTAVNDFIARNPSNNSVAITPPVPLDRLLDQFDYVRKLVGPDHVGLGPDFVEGLPPFVDELINDTVWPPDLNSRGPLLFVEGFQGISQLPNLVRGLIQRGWSTGELRKVLGENWLRVYERVWGA